MSPKSKSEGIKTVIPALPARARHTIKDIAQMAGVSRATVSLAMNGSPRINKKTRDKILNLIAEVGYRPNQTARNLVRRSTGTILVILPSIDHVFSDAYFAECLSGIVDVTTRRDFHMMVDLATPEFKQEMKALQLFHQGTVDGILCAGNLTTDMYLREIARAGCPIVLVNSSMAGVSRVIGANDRGAMAAVEHFHALGHRRIGHIRGPQFVTTAIDRTTGYLKALEKLGLDRDNDLIAEGFFDERSGYEAMRWLLTRADPPTAVFTTNDVMAIGAMRAIKEAGATVPDDIALFGGDDIQMAHLVTPPLSTLRQSMDVIGQTACEQLFLQIEDKPHRKAIEIDVELVIRESCGALRNSQLPEVCN